MRARAPRDVALYPELRNCAAASAVRFLEILADLARHHHQANQLVQVLEPELNELQGQALKLLGMLASIYRQSQP